MWGLRLDQSVPVKCNSLRQNISWEEISGLYTVTKDTFIDLKSNPPLPTKSCIKTCVEYTPYDFPLYCKSIG